MLRTADDDVFWEYDPADSLELGKRIDRVLINRRTSRLCPSGTPQIAYDYRGGWWTEVLHLHDGG